MTPPVRPQPQPGKTRSKSAACLHAWSGATAVVAAGLTIAAAAVPFPISQLLVVGTTVVRPSHVCALTVTLSAICLVIHAATRSRRTPTERLVSWRWVARRLTRSLVALTTLLALGWSIVSDLPSTYHVLEPSGPDGCLVVVDERSFLLLGSGVVHVLPAGRWTTSPVSQYSADDGYSPISLGTYSLTWQGNVGTLQLRGTEVAPVWPEYHYITCR